MYSIEQLPSITDPAILNYDGMHPDPLYDYKATPLSINSENVVVGSIATIHESVDFPGHSFAAVWQYGTLALLPTVNSGESATAYSINDSGTIVGCSGSTACRWDGQSVTLLDLPEVYIESCAYGVNSDGEIVGMIGSGIPGSYGMPCVWHRDGHLEVLNNIPFIEALAINDLGEVLLSDGLKLWTTWFDGAEIFKEVEVFKSAEVFEGLSGQATALNNNGVVVGFNFWTDVLHGIRNVPYGLLSVNDNGLAVGLINASQIAIMLQLPGSTLTYLNDFVTWTDEWDLSCATAVNNNGAIVGWGMKASKPAAFLLNPIRFSRSTRPVSINRFGKFSKSMGGPKEVAPSTGGPSRKEQAFRALAFAARRLTGSVRK